MVLADEQRQHFVVAPDSGLLERLAVVVQRHTVQEQALGGDGPVRVLGLDEGLEITDGEVFAQFMGDERLVRYVGDGYGDAWPI